MRSLCSKRFYSVASSSSSNLPQVTDPLLLYNSLVAQGKIQQDEFQKRMLVQLRKIHQVLVDYQPNPRYALMLSSPSAQSSETITDSDRPIWKRGSEISDSERSEITAMKRMSKKQREKALVKVLSTEQELMNLDTPTGFLLTGPPGTGKSLLMNLFFQSLPILHKKRVHYDHFLLSLYHQSFQHLHSSSLSLDQAHQSTQSPFSRQDENKAKALSKGWMAVFNSGRNINDPDLKKEYVLAKIARDIFMNEGWLLAFDEVQLVDVAGASILRRVLEYYWRLGGVVIGTSNRIPDDLYQHGIQRQQFLAFLSLLEARCPVLELNTPVDWRRTQRSPSSAIDLNERSSWYTSEDSALFKQAIKELIGEESGQSQMLQVYGRPVIVPWATESGIARFTFAELCSAALGPADYISIASKYHTLIIDQVPQIPISRKDVARRFITAIDALYETSTRLLVSAAAEPDDTFFPETGQPVSALSNSSTTDLGDDQVDMSASGTGVHPYHPSRIYEGDQSLPSRSRKQQQSSASHYEQPDSLVAEALSEVIQDLEQPYRPNVSAYDESANKKAFKRVEDVVAPAYRGSVSREDERHPSAKIPSFLNLAIFSGQDERFAFRRAVSRLHEITSPEYIKSAQHAPLQAEYRTWERKALDGVQVLQQPALYPVEDVEEDVSESKRRKKPVKFDPMQDVDRATLGPPKEIKEDHFWGMVYRKGTRWGRGVEERVSKK